MQTGTQIWAARLPRCKQTGPFLQLVPGAHWALPPSGSQPINSQQQIWGDWKESPLSLSKHVVRPGVGRPPSSSYLPPPPTLILTSQLPWHPSFTDKERKVRAVTRIAPKLTAASSDNTNKSNRNNDTVIRAIMIHWVELRPALQVFTHSTPSTTLDIGAIVSPLLHRCL